jgi:protein O-GlcNAc transferase
MDAALANYRQALAVKPDYDDAASNVLFALNFHPGYDAPAILRECRFWDEKFGRPLAHLIRPHTNDRSPDRRLRIGYLSPNFWAHSQAPFIYPLLREHDRREFEIYCYSDVVHADAVTAKLRGCAGVWRNCVGQSDQAVADMIRADAIDILVDLTMHMARGRPQVFARKPAPIQVAWLAYPGTTGLSAMDYRFTDAHLDPPGETDDGYVEKSVRLADTFACFDPNTLEPPGPLTPLPAERNGHITFGSLNNFFKVNVPLLKLWRRVLEAVPHSRFRLLAPEGSARRWVLETLPAEQVDFVSRQSRPGYLTELARIDICLDTLPYNGHTTTLDALWLGVPVVTRVGHTACGRAAASVLRNLGLAELIARDDDQFVTIAAGLAADLGRLSELRRTLRSRMSASVVLDAPRFAANVQAAYRRMWHEFAGAS